MDTFKIEIDAESKEFSLKIPFEQVKTFLEEERTLRLTPETFQQAYYFQNEAEDKQNFCLNAGIKDTFEEEEYDKEFWEDYHNNHTVEEEVKFDSEAGFITETGETISYAEEVGRETFGDQYYSPKENESSGDKGIE